jgi:hypothetical protein
VNRSFQFLKRSQDLIGAHNETLSVAAIGVNNLRYLASLKHTDRATHPFDWRIATMIHP